MLQADFQDAEENLKMKREEPREEMKEATTSSETPEDWRRQAKGKSTADLLRREQAICPEELPGILFHKCVEAVTLSSSERGCLRHGAFGKVTALKKGHEGGP